MIYVVMLTRPSPKAVGMILTETWWASTMDEAMEFGRKIAGGDRMVSIHEAKPVKDGSPAVTQEAWRYPPEPGW